jgi:hypothetical protein
MTKIETCGYLADDAAWHIRVYPFDGTGAVIVNVYRDGFHQDNNTCSGSPPYWCHPVNVFERFFGITMAGKVDKAIVRANAYIAERKAAEAAAREVVGDLAKKLGGKENVK